MHSAKVHSEQSTYVQQSNEHAHTPHFISKHSTPVSRAVHIRLAINSIAIRMVLGWRKENISILYRRNAAVGGCARHSRPKISEVDTLNPALTTPISTTNAAPTHTHTQAAHTLFFSLPVFYMKSTVDNVRVVLSF